MHNADLADQLQQLADGIHGLRQDLDRSEDMQPLPLAEALVKAVRLNSSFAKFADQTRKGIAPLFGRKPGDGGQAGGGKKPKK